MLGVELPDEEWDTVGGFLFGTLEHVPSPGESVELGGWRFTAEALDGRRVKLVRVAAAPAEAVGPERPTAPSSDVGGYRRRPWTSHSKARSRSSPGRRGASARRSPRGSPRPGPRSC